MKLTVCTDMHMFSKQVETKFEMILEEYNTDELILIGMPLEKLPLNCDGLPLIVKKIYDYIIDYGLYEEHLFDEAYYSTGRKDNIINAYKLVSGLGEVNKAIVDVNGIDVATVLVIWLYYLPEPLVSSKQYSLICDLDANKNYGDIINSMDNISKKTIHKIINIVYSYEKQHKSYKEKLGSLFTLLLTKHVDAASQNNALQFMENLKSVMMEVEIEHNFYMLNNKCSMLDANLNRDENLFSKNNLNNKKNLFRSLSDDGLLLKVGAAEANVSMKNNTLKKSTSSYNFKGFISDEDDSYNRLFQCGQSIDKNDSKAKPDNKLPNSFLGDCSVSTSDEIMCGSQIDDMRNVERTLPTHSRSIIKRNKKRSIKNNAEKILKSGFLSNEDSSLLKNTLELMKLLSKVKSVQNQIHIHKKNREDEFGHKNEDFENVFPELYFLNNRLEQLDNQKNNYLSKTGLSYGRLYNRTVLNLKNAQKEAFKRYEDMMNNKKGQEENVKKLISDINNIQIVLDYLENNCGGKELPWRSSRGCLGHRKKTKKQLNCVSLVSDLQTISEHEVMETIPQPLFISLES